MNQTELETLLTENYRALERYIRFRIADRATADDLLQEVCLTVLTRGTTLRQPESFRPWLYRVARNKLNDVYRTPSRELSSDKLDFIGRTSRPRTTHDAVSETLAALRESDRELLILCYMSDLTQKEAAERLHIPLGTLKTRLTAAKNRFRDRYPYTKEMEKNVMKRPNFPLVMPAYTIEQSPEPPFDVTHEALLGWGIVPRLDEKCAEASYDFPEKKRTSVTTLEAVGRTEIHGIEGVEIKTVETAWSGDAEIYSEDATERWFVAQLTDTRARILSEIHMENGVKKCMTFLDPVFLDNWGYGEDNSGFETHLTPRGKIVKTGNTVTVSPDCTEDIVLDLSGRFTVTIGGKAYDTVCLTDIEKYDTKVMTETYLDRDGRIVLWRRFNRDDWRYGSIGKLWTERFPENERVTINGETFVHWYDCIYDWIL